MKGRLISAEKSKYCKKSVQVVHCFFASLIFFFLSVNLFAQDLDLRNDCTGFKCTSGNIVILQVYLSDEDGNPLPPNFCNSIGPRPDVFISITYRTNQNTDSENARLIGDLFIGDTGTPILINYYIGKLERAKNSDKTIILKNYPIPWTCGQQLRISNPLIAWTPNDSKDLKDTYECDDYLSSQCQLTNDFIVNAPFSVDFDYVVCTIDDVTTVTAFSKVEGGIGPYRYSWFSTIVDLDDEKSASTTFTLPGSLGETSTLKLIVRQAIGISGFSDV